MIVLLLLIVGLHLIYERRTKKEEVEDELLGLLQHWKTSVLVRDYFSFYLSGNVLIFVLLLREYLLNTESFDIFPPVSLYF